MTINKKIKGIDVKVSQDSQKEVEIEEETRSYLARLCISSSDNICYKELKKRLDNIKLMGK